MSVILLTLAALLVTLTLPRVQKMDNLLINPGFEQATDGVPTGWSTVPPRATLTRVSSPSVAGSAAAFTNRAAGKMSFSQAVAAQPGSRYTLSGWCQKNDPNVAYVWLEMEWLPPAAAGPEPEPVVLWANRAEFQPLSVGPALAPPGTTTLVAQVWSEPVGNRSPATVICDEFSLTAEPSAATPTGTATSIATPSPIVTATSTRTRTPVPTASSTVTAAPTQPHPSTPTRTPTPTASRLAPGSIVINEVMVDPDEWVELRNTTGDALFLTGWSLEDNTEADLLPPFSLPPFGYAVISTSSMTLPAGVPLARPQDGRIGNGLANTGDRLRLTDSSGRVMDEVSWGSLGACPAPRRGHSLQRAPGACGFEESSAPSPGLPNTVTAPPRGSNSVFMPWLSRNGR